MPHVINEYMYDVTINCNNCTCTSTLCHFKDDYSLKVALYFSLAVDIVSMVTECEKELQTCHISQLETCLQCGSVYVYNDYGKSINN